MPFNTNYLLLSYSWLKSLMTCQHSSAPICHQMVSKYTWFPPSALTTVVIVWTGHRILITHPQPNSWH